MFRDTANSREAWAIAGATVIVLMACAAWFVIPTPKIIAAGLSVLALGGIFRIVRPLEYELVVDCDGIHWGTVGKKKKKTFSWSKIGSIRCNEIERELHIATGSIVLVTIPTFFLRSEEKKETFLAAVTRFSPATVIERS
jgi:hypothetical protein